MDEDKIQKKMKIGIYARWGMYLMIGMLVGFIAIGGYKYIQTKNVEKIVNLCEVHGAKTNEFYCCFGCEIEKYEGFTYIENADICICQSEGKSDLTLWKAEPKQEPVNIGEGFN